MVYLIPMTPLIQRIGCRKNVSCFSRRSPDRAELVECNPCSAPYNSCETRKLAPLSPAVMRETDKEKRCLKQTN